MCYVPKTPQKLKHEIERIDAELAELNKLMQQQDLPPGVLKSVEQQWRMKMMRRARLALALKLTEEKSKKEVNG